MCKVTDQIKNQVVNKPWGHEYLCYRNRSMAIWLLKIDSSKKTSLHCHPNKDTGYIVMKGKVKLNFLRGSTRIDGLNKASIFKKSFHRSENVGNEAAYILEAENPVDKNDLVRVEDKYGRKFKSYESSKYYSKKNGSELWIDNPKKEKITRSYFQDIIIDHFFLDDFKGRNFKSNDVFILTQGGFFKGTKNIILPAGVLDGSTLDFFIKNFKFKKSTKILHVH